MKVSELIQKKRATIHTAPATATVAEAARILLETEVSSLLVLEGDTASGIFTKNDLLRRYLESPTGFDRKELRDVQSKPLFSTESARVSCAGCEVLGRRHLLGAAEHPHTRP